MASKAKPGGAKRGPKSKADKAAAAAAKAAKPEAQAAPPQGSPASAGGSVIKLPTTGTIPKLVKQLESMGGDIREITSAMGEAVSKAQENKHVDKTALRWVRMMFKKLQSQPKAFALSFNHFVAYADEMGFANLADQHLGMDIGEGEGGEDDGEDTTAPAAPSDDTPSEQRAGGKSPGLSIVPGANAPESDVPAAPEGEATKAA